MVTSLVEIASDLANLYPEASPGKISEAIINTIESEFMLHEILKAIKLPSRVEKRREELRLKERYKKKKATQVKQKIKLISFFEKLKRISGTLAESSSSVSFASYDGDNVTIETPSIKPSDTNVAIQVKETMKPHVELQLLESMESHMMDDWYLELAKEPTLSTTKEIIFSPTKILEEMSERIESKLGLSFDDTLKINRILEFTDEKTTLNEILTALEKDIAFRKKKFHVDCIKDLYRDDDLLPPNMQTPHPRLGDVESLIQERLRAIILHEYRKLHRLTGQEFIEGKITYEKYKKKTKEYALVANKLFPK